MGHSKTINETVYQCPPSVLEACKVGRYLGDLDSGAITSAKPGNKRKATPTEAVPVASKLIFFLFFMIKNVLKST